MSKSYKPDTVVLQLTQMAPVLSSFLLIFFLKFNYSLNLFLKLAVKANEIFKA